jgi:hypothetical protein
VGGVFLSLVAVHLAYWIGARLFGPRYYYEGLPGLTIFSAAGMAWLAGWPLRVNQERRQASGWRKLRPLLVTWLVGVLVAINLILYTPIRLGNMVNLYGISAADQAPFLQPEVQALAPALVIVDAELWMDYGALLDLQDPYLTAPIIFAWTTNPEREYVLARSFPERGVYYYYPEREAWVLFGRPQP